MNNKVKKRKHRHRYNWCIWCDRAVIICGGIESFCKCGKVRPLNNKVEGVDE